MRRSEIIYRLNWFITHYPLFLNEWEVRKLRRFSWARIVGEQSLASEVCEKFWILVSNKLLQLQLFRSQVWVKVKSFELGARNNLSRAQTFRGRKKKQIENNFGTQRFATKLFLRRSPFFKLFRHDQFQFHKVSETHSGKSSTRKVWEILQDETCHPRNFLGSTRTCSL